MSLHYIWVSFIDSPVQPCPAGHCFSREPFYDFCLVYTWNGKTGLNTQTQIRRNFGQFSCTPHPSELSGREGLCGKERRKHVIGQEIYPAPPFPFFSLSMQPVPSYCPISTLWVPLLTLLPDLGQSILRGSSGELKNKRKVKLQQTCHFGTDAGSEAFLGETWNHWIAIDPAQVFIYLIHFIADQFSKFRGNTYNSIYTSVLSCVKTMMMDLKQSTMCLFDDAFLIIAKTID